MLKVDNLSPLEVCSSFDPNFPSQIQFLCRLRVSIFGLCGISDETALVSEIYSNSVIKQLLLLGDYCAFDLSLGRETSCI